MDCSQNDSLIDSLTPLVVKNISTLKIGCNQFNVEIIAMVFPNIEIMEPCTKFGETFKYLDTVFFSME